MYIKDIMLDNFRNFIGQHQFSFDKLNLILGEIGTGKSTLARIAVIFALYGESETALANLPSKGKNKCSVELHIEDKDNQITIYREYPSKLTIIVNDINILEGALNTEKEKWIVNRFGDYNYFKRFRMIDVKQGINILEEGKVALRKILVSLQESVLTNIRLNLQEKAKYYDKFNKDKSVIYKHCPSEKRYNYLFSANKTVSKSIQDLNLQINKLNQDKNYLFSSIATVKARYDSKKREIEEIRNNKPCPLCKQILGVEIRSEIVNQSYAILEQLWGIYQDLSEKLEDQDSAIEHLKKEDNMLKVKLQRMYNRLHRLETRLKQKEYIYTNRDILNIDKAVKELDKFFSQFILNSVKSLEPIINTVISYIGFGVEFRLDKKNDFDIVIKKNECEYSYKELSSGQRLLLTIGFQLAILIDRGDFGTIIADEGFNTLGSKDINALFGMLNNYPFQLLSIEHRVDNIPDNVKVINLI